MMHDANNYCLVNGAQSIHIYRWTVIHVTVDLKGKDTFQFIEEDKTLPDHHAYVRNGWKHAWNVWRFEVHAQLTHLVWLYPT